MVRLEHIDVVNFYERISIFQHARKKKQEQEKMKNQLTPMYENREKKKVNWKLIYVTIIFISASWLENL